MERVIKFASEKPIEFFGLLALILVASIAPLPTAKRYKWDSVRLKLSVSQRILYGIASQMVWFGLALLLLVDLGTGLRGMMAILGVPYGQFIILAIALMCIYVSRMISAFALNAICDATASTQ